MDGDQYILEVQETVFLSNSDVTVQNFIPDEPDSIIIQDGIENFAIEDVCYSPILEETDICDNIIIPEQVLDLDITEELSLAQFPVPDILGSSFTSTSLTMPEHVLMSEALHMSDVEHIEHVFHDGIVEAEVISDPLTADISEILVADCASEAVLDSSGMPLEQQDNIQVNCEYYFIIFCKSLATVIIKPLCFVCFCLFCFRQGLTTLYAEHELLILLSDTDKYQSFKCVPTCLNYQQNVFLFCFLCKYTYLFVYVHSGAQSQVYS